MLGFIDGIANPDVTDQAQMDGLVWIQPNTAASRPGPPAATTWSCG